MTACLVVLGQAHAGRPMATDDTQTLTRGDCQLEAWGDRADAEPSQVLAPACGLTDTLELDTAVSRNVGSGAKATALAAGLKWVPAEAVWETALGTIGLGAQAGVFWARDATSGWRAESMALAVLSSLAMGPEWHLYANVIATRRPSDGQWGNGVRTALAWQPVERWLLFVEGLAATDSTRVRNAGLRWWAVPQALGFDLVTTRSADGVQSFSLGLGWYGIRLP